MNQRFLTPEAIEAGIKFVNEGATVGVLLHDRETTILLSPKQIAGAVIQKNVRPGGDNSTLRYSVDVIVEVRGTPEEVTRSLIMQLAGQIEGLNEQIQRQSDAKPEPVAERE